MATVLPFEQRRKPQPLPADPLELPNSPDSETAVLGSILLNREAILAIKDWFAPDSFYQQRHTQIYQAMVDLATNGTPPDLRTVAGELQVRNQLEGIGGIGYLTTLVQSIPTSYHIEHYALQVDRAAFLREVIATGGKIATLGYRGDADGAALEVEQLTTQLLNGRRHGPAPVTGHISELWQKEFPPIIWVIEGLLLSGLTLFSGPPKMGKGLVATNLAAAVASGGMALGVVPCTQGDVLYIGVEDPEAELQTRFERALGGRPTDINLHYKTEWRPLHQGGLGDLARWLDEHPNARLVVIDTFSGVAPAEDGKKGAYNYDYTSLRPLQQLATKYPNLAILAITHNRKAEAANVLDMMSGTTGKQGAVDHIWIMVRRYGENTAELHAALRRAASWAKQVIFDPILATWQLGDDADIAKRNTVRADILEALADGAMWPKDLADTIDANRNTVRKQLSLLKQQGLVEDGDRGQSRLTDAGRRAIPADPTPDPFKNRGSAGSEDQRITPQTSTWRTLDGFETEQGVIPDPLILTDRGDPTDQLLGSAPPRERFYIRMYLRSNRDEDHVRAQSKCEQFGVDYAALYRLIRGSDPPIIAE